MQLLINLRGVGKPEWVETKKAEREVEREARKLEREEEKELRKAEREARKLEKKG